MSSGTVVILDCEEGYYKNWAGLSFDDMKEYLTKKKDLVRNNLLKKGFRKIELDKWTVTGFLIDIDHLYEVHFNKYDWAYLVGIIYNDDTTIEEVKFQDLDKKENN